MPNQYRMSYFGRGYETLAVAACEGAAGCHVRQQCRFGSPHIRSVAYLSGQEFEILVAGNHLEDLLHGDFAEGEERGRSNSRMSVRAAGEWRLSSLPERCIPKTKHKISRKVWTKPKKLFFFQNVLDFQNTTWNYEKQKNRRFWYVRTNVKINNILRCIFNN